MNLKKAIEVNVQLKSLKLRHNVDDFRFYYCRDEDGIKINGRLLQFLQDNLPKLECLDVTCAQTSWRHEDLWHNGIGFAKLKKLRINVDETLTLRYYTMVS